MWSWSTFMWQYSRVSWLRQAAHYQAVHGHVRLEQSDAKDRRKVEHTCEVMSADGMINSFCRLPAARIFPVILCLNVICYIHELFVRINGCHCNLYCILFLCLWHVGLNDFQRVLFRRLCFFFYYGLSHVSVCVLGNERTTRLVVADPIRDGQIKSRCVLISFRAQLNELQVADNMPKVTSSLCVNLLAKGGKPAVCPASGFGVFPAVACCRE